jgi:hypothetical protein
MRRVLPLCLLLLALGAPASARAHDGPHGDHNDTVQELDTVDVVKEVGQARLSAMDVGVAATGLPTTWCGAETTTDNTADAVFDKTLPQFKVIYAYPADRPDRFDQWKDALQANLSLIEQFVSSQPGSTRAPRFDMGTSCGSYYLDIQTVALPAARSTYVQNMNAVETYVKTMVNPSPGGRRNYVIIADTLSSGTLNGVGELYEGSTSSQRPDSANIHNTGGLTSVLWVPDTAPPGTDPNGWWPEGVLHEMTHNMGGVQWGSPHSSQPAGGSNYTYSHCWDGRDVMCYQDGPAMSHAYSSAVCAAIGGAMPQTYDCGQDDYFNPAPSPGSYLATHWNVYNNVFMAECGSLPAGSCLVSGPTDPPSNTTPPSITGTPATGELLSADKGVWDGAVSYQYMWLRDGATITGATSSSYRLTTADRGSMIRVRVTGVNPWGTIAQLSPEVGPVAPRPPALVTEPVITGTLTSGSLLTTSIGSWSPAGVSYTFQWERSVGGGAFTPIPGATRATYRLVTADDGAFLRVSVTAINPDGSLSAVSEDVGPVVVQAPVNTVLPRIIGAAKTGAVLTATTGTWNPAGTGYAIQWQRDTGSGYADIAGAKFSTFRLGAPDRGAKLRVKVTSVNGAIAVDAYSAELGPVAAQPPVNVALPRLTGGALVGTTLAGTAGSWSPAGTSYSYQWQRDAGSGFTNISGATRTAYKLATADKDAKVRLRVFATNPDGTAYAYSAEAGPVAAPAASLSLSAGGSSSLRGSSGALLASARVSGPSAGASNFRALPASAFAAGAGGDTTARVALAASAGRTLTVKVRRAAKARGKLRVMACGTTCTSLRTLGRRPVTLKVAATGRVRISLARG